MRGSNWTFVVLLLIAACHDAAAFVPTFPTTTSRRSILQSAKHNAHVDDNTDYDDENGPAINHVSRRSILINSVTALPILLPPANAASATDNYFSTGQAEYTNSIVASRDTNISPKEVYDTILERLPKANNSTVMRALDVGAGAGVSTMYIYNQLGYRQHVDAVDWSRDAWDNFVDQNKLPNAIHFYQATDDEFFNSIINKQQDTTNLYDIIVYNFAINANKARQVATTWLVDAPESRLLAPVNEQTDYWYKQRYWLLDSKGQVLYTSQAEVGAWSVQFQPDVTSPTCTGFWCGNMNGFLNMQQKKR